MERQIAAGERGKEGGRGKKKTLGANDPKGKRAPRARDKVAKTTGKKARTLAKAEAVVAAAERDPPSRPSPAAVLLDPDADGLPMHPLTLRLAGKRLDGKIPRGLESLGPRRRVAQVLGHSRRIRVIRRRLSRSQHRTQKQDRLSALVVGCPPYVA